MSAVPLPPPTPPTGKRLAELIADFLGTDLGKAYIAALGLEYNALHQQAEDESLSAERKAMKIERAAGLKWSIDYLMSRKHNLENGVYDQKKPRLS